MRHATELPSSAHDNEITLHEHYQRSMLLLTNLSRRHVASIVAASATLSSDCNKDYDLCRQKPLGRQNATRDNKVRRDRNLCPLHAAYVL
jgi:hypothetical protein